MKRCPACQSAQHWGAPAGYHIVKGLPVRCEVCKGHGVTTTTNIMAWELSL